MKQVLIHKGKAQVSQVPAPHGRLEQRIAYSSEAIDWLQKEH